MNLKLLVAVKESGLLQYEVAAKAGVTESTVSRLINERHGMKFRKDPRPGIAKALGKKTSELFDKEPR